MHYLPDPATGRRISDDGQIAVTCWGPGGLAIGDTFEQSGPDGPVLERVTARTIDPGSGALVVHTVPHEEV